MALRINGNLDDPASANSIPGIRSSADYDISIDFTIQNGIDNIKVCERNG